MQDVQAPPQEQMMQFIMGKIISRSVYLAADLSISDYLSNGPMDIKALADKAEVKTDPLYRVLRTLAAVGIYRELDDQVFANNDLSETLCSDHPASLRNFARWFGADIHYKIYSNMDYSVRTGKPAIKKMHPEMDPFQALSRYDEDQQKFQQAMSDMSKMEGQAILEAYNFSRFDTVADVGGGFGALAGYIKKASPQSEIILFDLPHVIEEIDGDLQGKIQTYKGSFLNKLPFSADLIILKRIIHDWSDENAVKILKNCKAALNDKGKILICDALITDGEEGIPAKLMDIEMLVGNGGRDRTLEEVESLLDKSKLYLQKTISTKAGVWLMEASKQ